MKRIIAFVVGLGFATAAMADVAVTDRLSMMRILGRTSHGLLPLRATGPKHTPSERAARKAANIAKQLAEKKHPRKNSKRSVMAARPRPGTNGIGSVSLIDASGLEYFINTDVTFTTTSSASGAAFNATYTTVVTATVSQTATTTTTLTDAFDGYNSLCVSPTGALTQCATGDPNFVVYNLNGPATVDATCTTGASPNRQINFPTQTVNISNVPVDVTRKVMVPSNDTFIRWLNIFTNTGVAPVTFSMVTANNLGSDTNTAITGTGNGDQIAQTTDTWVATGQRLGALCCNGDPRLGHILQGTGAPTPVAVSSFADGDSFPFWGYNITLQPGQTKIIMNFTTGQPSIALAHSNSQRITSLPPTTLQCMSNAELNQVVNFLMPTDVGIVKSAPATVNANTLFNYTLNVTNNGTFDASTVTVNDPLPAGVTFSSVNAPGWSCTTPAVGTNGTVSCSLATLAASASATPITIGVTAPATAGPSTNTATVTIANPDTNSANDLSPAMTTVLSSANVSGTKTASGSFAVGSAVTYTVLLSNSGPATQLDNPGNEFTDTLPGNLTLVSANASSGTASIAANTVTWNGSIPASGNVTITITATINSGSLGQQVSNQGTISYDADGNGTNESTRLTDDPSQPGPADATTFAITGAPNITGTKTVNAPTFAAGDTLVYTIVLHNTGNAAQNDNPGPEFTDTIPAGLQLQSASATSGTTTAAIPTRTVTWNGSIPAGGTVTITINARVTSSAGGTITNQGQIFFDANGDGINESVALTDDPNQPGAADPTPAFVAGQNVPALSPLGLLIALIAMAAVALMAIKRS